MFVYGWSRRKKPKDWEILVWSISSSKSFYLISRTAIGFILLFITTTTSTTTTTRITTSAASNIFRLENKYSLVLLPRKKKHVGMSTAFFSLLFSDPCVSLSFSRSYPPDFSDLMSIHWNFLPNDFSFHCMRIEKEKFHQSINHEMMFYFRFTIGTDQLYSGCCWSTNTNINSSGWTALFRISFNTTANANGCCWSTSSRFSITTK